jgi:inorganic pyrophosphatase
MNVWHNINPGKNSPDVVNVIIEIPENSKVKYELDKDTGLLKVDRILYSAIHYPLNYGFIPQTYCEDKDPLDVLVMAQFPLLSNCLVEVRPIGLFEMIDNGERDDKIISIAIGDPVISHIDDIEQISPHKIKEIKHFFETYKQLEKNTKNIIKHILGKKEALDVINEAINLYNRVFKKI